jgi:uncharacterized spore protein YtfJ
MSLNRLFDTMEKARQTAHWRAVFGEAQVLEERTIIPVARVRYGFGFGFGQGVGPSDQGDEPASGGEGGGGGGASSARSLGAVVVTPERVYFEPVQDTTKIALAAICMGALSAAQLAITLRAIFGRE